MPVAADPIVYPPGPYVDVPDLLQDWCKTVLGYTNVVADGEPPRNLTDLIRTAPVIVVDRFGGAEDVVTIDNANVNVTTFANSIDGAKHHAAFIHSALMTRLRGHTYQGTVVTRVQAIRQPIKLPWDSRNVIHARSAAYQIRLHQFSGVA